MKAGYKECPYCGEEIKKDAKKCRYCREFLYKNEDIDTNESESGFIDNMKVNAYFLSQPFCPYCNNSLDERDYKCEYCGEEIDCFKYYIVETNHTWYYKYDEKKETNYVPYAYCSSCGYLGYLKKKSKWKFSDDGWGRIGLMFGSIRLEHLKGFICPKCKSNSLLLNGLEQKKLEFYKFLH